MPLPSNTIYPSDDLLPSAYSGIYGLRFNLSGFLTIYLLEYSGESGDYTESRLLTAFQNYGGIQEFSVELFVDRLRVSFPYGSIIDGDLLPHYDISYANPTAVIGIETSTSQEQPVETYFISAEARSSIPQEPQELTVNVVPSNKTLLFRVNNAPIVDQVSKYNFKIFNEFRTVQTQEETNNSIIDIVPPGTYTVQAWTTNSSPFQIDED